MTMNVFARLGLALGVGLFASLIGVMLTRRAVSGRASMISSQVANGIFGLLAIAYMFIFGALSILRHLSYHSGGEDLGVFDQVIWNSLQGRLFEGTILVGFASKLGNHFSPILLALVPFYAVWSDPIMLLVIQTGALALGAVPIYWFARKNLGQITALVVVAAYFLYPSTQYVNLFEFHEIALATPLLAFALYFLLNYRYAPFLLCLFLAIQTKEEVTFVGVAFGLYIGLIQHRFRFGFTLALLSGIWGAALLLYVIPFFRGAENGSSYFFVDRYKYLGNSIPEIVLTIVTQPGLVIQHLIIPRKIEFVLQLLVPVVLVPLASLSVFALALPTFAYLLVSDNPYQTSIQFQYTAPLIPIVFFALIDGLSKIRRWELFQARPAWQGGVVFCLGVTSLVNYTLQSPGIFGFNFDATQYDRNARTTIAEQIIRQVPNGVIVAAESNLVPHLSQRRTIYQAPVIPNLREIEYVLADRDFPSHQEYADIWAEVLTGPFFDTVVDQDGLLLRKRVLPRMSKQTNLQFGERITLLGYTIGMSSSSQASRVVNILLVWRADQPIRDRYVVFVHLLDNRGNILAQGDREPANGWLRTDRWNTGDITPDQYLLELDSGVPLGDYQIIVGLYDSNTGERLKMANDQTYAWIENFVLR
jgi:uncharacterized membrane protein